MPLKDMLNGYLRPSREFFGIPEPQEGLPDVGILGIPYDLTSSHTPGARFGPDAIRRATDSERSHSYPLRLSRPNSDKDEALSDLITLEDIGDLELGVQLPESVMVHISDAAKILNDQGTKMLLLGGDHFITYPFLRGFSRQNEDVLGLVYIDAHTDFYEDMGGLTLSHASTLKRIISEDIVSIEHVVGYDFRCATPHQRNALGESICPTDRSALSERVHQMAESVDSIYISVDIDSLQPQIAPAVSHPESGGLTLVELVQIIDDCFSTDKIRYADIVELNPLLEGNRITEIAARDIVKAILTGFAYHK